ncbi:unnamed protein product [Lactuca saligna]|uniref:BED-type domain-containing protein n=1 Tax=Lactuca saligna TaxID=75948 RepID=A0AA36E0Y5_LACSI|nr:unnamed protein product [Lactuca saligna]
MENLTSESENKMANIAEISEKYVHGVQSPTPPTGDIEKNPKPVKQLKPQKTSVDVKRHKKLMSEIWKDFEFLDTDENGELHCKCRKCGQVYKSETRMGTRNLKHHLSICKPSCLRDIGQMVLDIGGNGGSITSRVLEFNPNTFRELLATTIVRHDQPFKFVEYEVVRKCFTYLNPEVKMVARNTIKAKVLDIYKMEKMKMTKALSCIPGRICLTSDSWICSSKKVFSITLANASANDAIVDYLKTEIDLVCEVAYFHVRCYAHIKNLIVQDSLKEVDNAVTKV